jgi:hypothetical protein
MFPRKQSRVLPFSRPSRWAGDKSFFGWVAVHWDGTLNWKVHPSLSPRFFGQLNPLGKYLLKHHRIAKSYPHTSCSSLGPDFEAWENWFWYALKWLRSWGCLMGPTYQGTYPSCKSKGDSGQRISRSLRRFDTPNYLLKHMVSPQATQTQTDRKTNLLAFWN